MEKLIVGSFLLSVLLLLISVPHTESFVRAEPLPEKIVKVEVKQVKKNKKVSTREFTEEEKREIERIFGSNAKIATAVLKHESGGLNLRAQNWNCWYHRENGQKYSTSCKTIQDRANAWSVDCGIAQINVRGKVCPAHLFTFEGSIPVIEKKYREQGLSAWVSYTNGAYKRFLD